MKPRAPYDPWRDAAGAPVDVGHRVQQIAVDKEHGALRSRLHREGEVVWCGVRGRGYLRLYVRFDGESAYRSIRPHLVRVVES
jgi:hypothetical protein